MGTWSKTLGTVGVFLLLTGIATAPRAQVSGGGLLHMRGDVVCAQCSLDEVREGHSEPYKLYQLMHEKGQVVMRVTAINNSPAWRYFTWPPEIRVRAKDSVFEQLAAEEHLFQEVELTALLSTTRALDIFTVTILG